MAPVRLAAVLLLLLLSPCVQAAPAKGQVEVEGAVRFPEGVALWAARGDLLHVAPGVPVVDMDAQGLDLRRIGTRVATAQTPLGPVEVNHAAVDDRASHGPSSLRLAPGAGESYVLLRSSGAVASAAHAAQLRPVSEVLLAKGANSPSCPPETCARAADVFELAAEVLEADFAGDVVLFLRGPALLVTENGRETRYASGETEEQSPGTTVVENTWIVAHVRGAKSHVSAEQGRWYFPSGALEGPSVLIPQATGFIDVGPRSYRASSEALEAKGRVRLVPEPLRGSDLRAPDQGVPLYASGFASSLEGEVEALNLRASPVLRDEAVAGAGSLVGLAALVAALAYFWPLIQFHATSLSLPLYSRLRKPDVLDNQLRNHVYEIIRQNPGISARAIHRLSGQSWGTVVYHLRQLERHHLVISRTLGRTRNYYENHGKYKGMEVPLAYLQSDRARALARMVLARPGITQEDLATASGFPQATTSYYVRKLRSAGLVQEQREGRYVRYAPGPELARYVSLAEEAGQEAAVPPSSTGVQA